MKKSPPQKKIPPKSGFSSEIAGSLPPITTAITVKPLFIGLSVLWQGDDATINLLIPDLGVEVMLNSALGLVDDSAMKLVIHVALNSSPELCWNWHMILVHGLSSGLAPTLALELMPELAWDLVMATPILK